MGGFRRAQLRGSDELFRTTGEETEAAAETGDVAVTGTVTKPAPLEDSSAVPGAPAHDSRSLRLTVQEIEIIADALQHLKFPSKQPARPSVDEFETLEELRQRLLDAL